MDRLLIDHLVSSGLTSPADVQRKILKAKALKVGVLAQMFDEKVDETKMAAALAEYYDSQVLDESLFEVSDTALKFLSQKMANKHGVLPFAVSDSADHVTVAVFNPESASEVLKTLRTATGSDPTIQIARKSWLEGAIRHYYFGEEWADKPIEILDLDPDSEPESAEPTDQPPLGMTTPQSSHNAIGRLKPKRRTIITPVHTAEPAQVHDESAEILLDDVVAMNPTPKQRLQTPSAKTAQKKPTRPGSEVDQALNDFDAFLNASSSARIVDPNLSDIPGWTSPPQPSGGQNASWSNPNQNLNQGFDLFSEAGSDGPSDSLEETVHEQAILIAQLRKDIEQQRGIIQALVDILSEARLVSKREIKRRLDSGN